MAASALQVSFIEDPLLLALSSSIKLILIITFNKNMDYIASSVTLSGDSLINAGVAGQPDERDVQAMSIDKKREA